MIADRSLLEELQPSSKGVEVLEGIKAFEDAQDKGRQAIIKQLQEFQEANTMATIRDDIAGLRTLLTTGTTSLTEIVNASNADITAMLASQSHDISSHFQKPISSLETTLEDLRTEVTTSTTDIISFLAASLQDTQSHMQAYLQAPFSDLSTKVETSARMVEDNHSSLRDDMMRFDPKSNGLEEVIKMTESIPQILPVVRMNAEALKEIESKLNDTATTLNDLILKSNDKLSTNLRETHETVQTIQSKLTSSTSPLSTLSTQTRSQKDLTYLNELMSGLTIQLEGVEKGLEIIGRRVVGTRAWW